MVNPQEIFAQIQNKLMSGTPLDEEDLNFVNENLPDEGKKQIFALNKYNSGQDLDKEEEAIVKQILQSSQGGGQLPMSDESRANFQRFETEKSNAKFQVNHITDIHNSSKNFEQILIGNLYKSDHLEYDENGKIVLGNQKFKLKDGVSIAITGDVGTDFFDQQNHGLEAFLTDTIVDKGGYNDSDAAELKELYLGLMHMAGLDEEMIRTMSPEAFGEGGAFQKFHTYLFGMQEPGFLTDDEKEEFLEKRKRLHELLTQGMEHHGRKEYSEIRGVLEKFDIDSNRAVFVSGNHDQPRIMEEELGSYMLKPGQVRNVGGLKYGNMVDSANGNFTGGPHFNNVFGYAGLREELESVEHNSDAFKAVKNELTNVGIKMSDREISRYMDVSMQKAAMGIGTGAAADYKINKIKPLLEEHVKQRTLSLKNYIPKGADVILQHSMIDHPQDAGIEERVAHELIAKELPGAIVLHGHEHAPTPHRKDNVYHLNPGSAASGNSAVHLFGDDKSYQSSLFKSSDDNLNDVYRHIKKDEMPGHPSGRYNKAG